MKPARVILPILGLLLLAEAGLIYIEWTQLKSLRALAERAGVVSGQVRAADLRVEHLRQAIAIAEGQAKSKAAAAASRKTAQEARAAAQNVNARRVAQAFLESLDHQEFQSALNQLDRAYNERTAGAFLRSLGLNPEQVNHMLDLMGKMMIAMMDANQAATASGLDQRSRLALIVDTQKDIAAEIQGYLGDANFAAYQQFNSQYNVRSIASGLQNSLGYSSTPLSEAQAQQLVSALYQTEPASLKAADTVGVGALYALSSPPPIAAVTPAELSAAETILSAPQMAALRSIYAGQQAMRALRRAGGF